MFFNQPFLIGCFCALFFTSVEASPYTSSTRFSSYGSSAPTAISHQRSNTALSNSTSTTASSLSSSSTPLNSTASRISLNSTTTYIKTLPTPSPSLSHSSNVTATRSRWYGYSNITVNSGEPTPEPAVLVPNIPPHINPHDPAVLQPNKSVSLFYQDAARSNASDVQVASVAIPQMAYPAVVLDHSALVTHVECDSSTLRMRFLHEEALKVASNSWTMPKFVMMTFHDGCGGAGSTGERDYLLVHNLDFNHDDLTVAAGIEHVGIAKAVGDENPITVDMGTYTPANASGKVGFDSQAAPSTGQRSGTYTNTTGTVTDFDILLDDSLGYVNMSISTAVKRFVGLEPRAMLHIRSWCHICDKVVKVVKKIVNTFIPSWTVTPLNKDINIGIGGGNVNTPWGKKGYQFYSKDSGTNYVRLYCVDCGVSGVINVKATLTFTAIGLVTAGSFTASGHMGAGLGLGIDANYATSIPGFSQTLVAIPLSPFAIPGIITIGPHLDLGVGANANFNANGKAYAGVALEWPALNAQINLFSAPSASGFTPKVTSIFQADGSVTLGADAYVTVTIGFGVSILNGLKSFGVSLVDKPDLYITGTSTNPTCKGVQITAGFKNEVYADIFGSHKEITTWNGPSAGKCISIKKRDNVLTPSAPATRRRSINGTTVQIQSLDQTIGIHYADNGNLYALPQGNASLVDMSTVNFATADAAIVTGDIGGRVFHGYSDTLSNLGVSRFRLSKPSHIPTTALLVTLQKATFEDDQGILIALDTAHNVFYPVLCTFGDDNFPRLFLAKDPSSGVDTLTDDENVATITGIKPDDCDFIPLVTV